MAFRWESAFLDRECVISVGLKPTTSRTGICCSIQLSYETIHECKVNELI